MAQTTDTWQPPGGGVPARRRLRDRRGVLLVLLVLVPVGGFFFGRALWWSLKPAPDFPSLAQTPDPSLHGSIAFLKPHPDDNCIFVVAASGGQPEKAACVEGAEGGGTLEWLEDGRIQLTGYGNAQEPDKWRVFVDVETGDVESVPKDQIPEQPDDPMESPGPNGEKVASEGGHGTLKVTLTTEDGKRTLLSVGAPDTYAWSLPAWSPDGEWFVVKDDLDRLLLVTTSDPSQTRVLVEGGWGQAVTGDDLLGG